jgi:hypothetical protein
MTKNLLCLLLVFQALLGVASAQDVITKFSGGTIATRDSIEIKTGELCEIVAVAGQVEVSSQSDLDTSPSRAYLSVSSPGFVQASPLLVAGPCWIGIGWGGQGVLSYRIRSNTASATSTPANAVVIPTDATGSVQIILESSTDLITWTQANPGTYGASTTKRFFRIRAVNQ